MRRTYLLLVGHTCCNLLRSQYGRGNKFGSTLEVRSRVDLALPLRGEEEAWPLTGFTEVLDPNAMWRLKAAVIDH